jgi:hypothetical protein
MFLFRALRPIDAAFARHADASSYRALLREMQAADLYAGTPYAVLQKRAGRMWSALKKYRAQQRAARTHVVPTVYIRRLSAAPVASLDSGKVWGDERWPSAHAGCVMQ